ncbi:hypothetical protein [Vibrio paucivorans]
MNNPKVYVLCLLVAFGILFAVLKLQPDTSINVETQATVLESTLTQSLDGHRRYLTVETQQAKLYRVSVPITNECTKGDTVKLRGNTSNLETSTSFQFISCK